MKFFGGSMSFTGFFADDIPAFDGCTRCEMVGNGRRARDEGKDVLRFGITRWAGGTPDDCDDWASGDETAGRVIVRVIVAVSKAMVSSMLQTARRIYTHPFDCSEISGGSFD